MNAFTKLYGGARKAFWFSQADLSPVALCMVTTLFRLAHQPPDAYGLHGGSRVFEDDLDEADVVEWQRKA